MVVLPPGKHSPSGLVKAPLMDLDSTGFSSNRRRDGDHFFTRIYGTLGLKVGFSLKEFYL